METLGTFTTSGDIPDGARPRTRYGQRVDSEISFKNGAQRGAISFENGDFCDNDNDVNDSGRDVDEISHRTGHCSKSGDNGGVSRNSCTRIQTKHGDDLRDVMSVDMQCSASVFDGQTSQNVEQVDTENFDEIYEQRCRELENELSQLRVMHKMRQWRRRNADADLHGSIKSDDQLRNNDHTGASNKIKRILPQQPAGSMQNSKCTKPIPYITCDNQPRHYGVTPDNIHINQTTNCNDNASVVQYQTDSNKSTRDRGKPHRFRSQSNSRKRDTRVFMKPPKFDGNTRLDEFLLAFENASEYNNWNSEDKAFQLRNCLEGQARHLLNYLMSLSYDQVVSKLQERFGTRDQQERFRTEINCRRRKRGESVIELAESIRSLMTLAYSGDPSDSTNEAVARDAFLRALDDPEMELKVRERDPRNLDMACKIALHIENSRHAVSEHNGFNRSRNVRNINDDTDNRQGDVKASHGTNEVTNRLEKELADAHKLISEMEQTTNFLKKENERLEYIRTVKDLLPKNMNPSAPRDSQPITIGNYSSVVCYRCKERGHISRNCPNRQRPSVPNSYRQNVNRIGKSRSFYLMAIVNTVPTECLIDTGSDYTVIPSKYVEGLEIRPTTVQLKAVNGSLIEVLGEVDLMFKLKVETDPVTAIVSDHVSEPIIGTDWMMANRATISLHNGTIQINGKENNLICKGPCGWTRRSVLEQDVMIPNLCEKDVLTRVEYSARGRRELIRPSALGIEATTIVPGVHVPRIALPLRNSNVPVRIMNVSGNDIVLKAGTVVSDIKPFEIVDVSGTCNSVKTEEGDIIIDDMLSKIDNSVPENVKHSLKSLLTEYVDAFSTSENEMSVTDVIMHNIDTGNSRPFRQSLRPQPKALREESEPLLDEMLKQGIVQSSSSPWASNIVLVRKKDNSLRWCIDFRQLNNLTKKDAYPLPRIDTCLDALSGSSWFSTFDLRSSYHQVKLNPADAEKTAFICYRGQFEFKTMPFGLCNAGATFQRLVDVVLNGVAFNKCIAYVDDIIVYSKSLDEHIDRLRDILQRIQYAKLKLKPSKCQLLQKSVQFLGHVVSEHGISTDPKKVEDVKNWPVPSSVKEVRTFLGFASYYRKYVKGFAEIASPLHELCKKNVTFAWSQMCDLSFLKLKELLTSSPILAMPVDGCKYILDTDASDHSMGAVLSQIQNGEEKVIAYASKSFNHMQRNYCVTRKELLAVVNFLRHFKQYLYGQKFVVRTDHAALTWFKKSKDLIGQPGRWLEFMEEFDFDIIHRIGARHVNADSMSRIPCKRKSCFCHGLGSCNTVQSGNVRQVCEPADQSMVTEICGRDELRIAQDHDVDINFIKEHVKHDNARLSWDEIATRSDEIKALWFQWERLKIVDGLLCRRFESANGAVTTWQVVVPASHRKRYIRLAHEGFTGGHLGRKKTEINVCRRAFWPNWRLDVAETLRECPKCACYHRGVIPKQGNLKPFLTGAPWERISIDITGKHPKSKRGNEYIMTVVDHFSKWAEAFAIRDHTATTVSRILVKEVISRFGCPLQILTDQGPEFESLLFKQLCDGLQIDKIRTSSYKPSTNATVERFHRTLNSMLAKCVSETQRDWDEHIPMVLSAYRASVHESTGYSPNRLMFGRENTMPVDIIMGSVNPSSCDTYEEYVSDILQRLRDSYYQARQHLQKSAERRKKYYDIRVKEKKFSSGEWVWYLYPRRYSGRSAKWQNPYIGPFLITREIPPLNYVIQRSKRSTPLVVHVDKLKKYFGDAPQAWMSEHPITLVDSNETGALGDTEKRHDPSSLDEIPYVVNDTNVTTRKRRMPVRFNDYVVEHIIQ